MNQLQNQKRQGQDAPEVGDLYVCLTRTRPLRDLDETLDDLRAIGVGYPQNLNQECLPGDIVLVVGRPNTFYYRVLHKEKVVVLDRPKLMHMFRHLPRVV